MARFRRLIALLMLVSFAGAQPAAASCSMGTSEAPAPDAGGAAHAHHATTPGTSADAPGTDTRGHADHGTACGPSMVCAVTGPPAATGVIPSVPMGAEIPVRVSRSADLSPDLTCDPPPPRQDL